MRRVLASVAVTLLLVACTGEAERAEESGPVVEVATETETVAEGAPAADAQSESESEDAAPRASAAPVATEAVASALGEVEGTRLDILSLVRSGETVTLNFAIVNETAEAIDFGSVAAFAPSGGGIDYFTVAGVTLTDDVNQQRYLVLREPEGLCVCSVDVNTSSLPGDSRGLYFAKFPAPPDDVEVMSVQLPNFTSVDGVAVSG